MGTRRSLNSSLTAWIVVALWLLLTAPPALHAEGESVGGFPNWAKRVPPPGHIGGWRTLIGWGTFQKRASPGRRWGDFPWTPSNIFVAFPCPADTLFPGSRKW